MLSSYGGKVPSSCPIPYIEHLFPSSSLEEPPPLTCPELDDDFDPYAETKRSYTYPPPSGSASGGKGIGTQRAFAVLPEYGDRTYDHSAAALAHTRTLQFLKPRIGGPWFDLERVGGPQAVSVRNDTDVILALFPRFGSSIHGTSLSVEAWPRRWV